MEESLQRLREFLHQRSFRMTPVREVLLKEVLAQKGHFEIEDFLRDLQGRGVRISRATAYRIIPLLIEAGFLQQTVISGQKRQYEVAFGKKHHDHLICCQCGEVVEFQFEAFEILEREVAAKNGFRLMNHFHELIGVCHGCQGDHGAEKR